MILQRVNRTDPERVFIVVKNSYSTATITNGQWVSFDITTDKDGVAVTKPAARNLMPVAGVVVESINNNEFGLVQNWGFKNDARCLGGSGIGASKISARTPLAFPTSGFAARAVALTSATVVNTFDLVHSPCAVAIEPLNTAAIATQAGTSGAYLVMIRCLG